MTAPEVTSITSFSETLWARMRCGSTCTWNILGRSPQIGTLATPGMRSKRARIFQYATIERSIRSCSFDEIPIFMMRLVEDIG